MKNSSQKFSFWWVVLAVIATLVGAGLAAYFSWLAIPIVIGILVFLTAIVLVLDKPWLGVALVAFFLPFERIGGIEIVGETTLRLSQVFAVVTIASWILYYLLIKRRSYARPAIMWPLLAYLAFAAISIVNAVNFERALTVYVFSAFVIIFALTIPQVVRTVRQARWIIWALLLSALIVSLFGLYQFAGDVVGLPESLTGLREHYTGSVFGFPRVHSTALEPLYFANYLLIPIAIAFLLWLGKTKLAVKDKAGKLARIFNSRWFLLAVVLTGIIALVLTLSRGGYLGLIATAVMLLIIGWRQIFTHRNIYIIVIAALAIAVAAIGFLNFSGRFSVDAFIEQATEYQGGAGVEERYQTYDEAKKLFAAHPLFGVGIGNFGPEVATYPHRMPEGGWLIVNNEPLELLAETGILGFAAIMGMLIILFWQSVLSWRKLKNITSEPDRRFLRAVLGGLVAALVGILVQYQTFSTLYILHIWFVIGLMTAVCVLIHLRSQKPDEN